MGKALPLLTLLLTALASAPSQAGSEVEIPAKAPETLEAVTVQGIASPLTLSRSVLDEALRLFKKHGHATGPVPELYLVDTRASSGNVSAPPLKASFTPGDRGDGTKELTADSAGRIRVSDLVARSAEDGDITFNRRSQANDLYFQVRSAPDLPTELRLGDLRLECRVNTVLFKQQMPLVMRMAFSMVDLCTSSKVAIGLPYKAGEAGAVLVDGARSLPFPTPGALIDLHLPLKDSSWSDSAILSLNAKSR